MTSCPWYRSLANKVRKEPAAYPDYMFFNKQLYRHLRHTLDFRDHTDREQWKRYVPRTERKALIQRLHSDPTAGHFGVAETIARIAQLYWPGMFREIARHVQECENCLAHKAYQGKPAGFAHAHNVTEPWQQVTTDP